MLEAANSGRMRCLASRSDADHSSNVVSNEAQGIRLSVRNP